MKTVFRMQSYQIHFVLLLVIHLINELYVGEKVYVMRVLNTKAKLGCGIIYSELECLPLLMLQAVSYHMIESTAKLNST